MPVVTSLTQPNGRQRVTITNNNWTSVVTRMTRNLRAINVPSRCMCDAGHCMLHSTRCTVQNKQQNRKRDSFLTDNWTNLMPSYKQIIVLNNPISWWISLQQRYKSNYHALKRGRQEIFCCTQQCTFFWLLKQNQHIFKKTICVLDTAMHVRVRM